MFYDWKRASCIACLIMMALLLCGCHTAPKARVYLLAGQSNMAGAGTYTELKAPYDKHPQAVKIWTKQGWQSLGPGISANTNRFGPEIAFGHAMHQAYPDDEVYLIKVAAGGTSLFGSWAPLGSANAPKGGPMYRRFITNALAALKDLDESQKAYRIEGMLWMQGESDAHNGKGDAYEANLTAFIGKVRSEFDQADMPFILGRIIPHFDRPPGNNALVRAAQQSVAEDLDHVTWFDTDGYDRLNPGHYNTQGQIQLGKDFARTLLAEE